MLHYSAASEQRFTLDEICDGLECAGYAVQPFVVPACAVGAPRRRDRVSSSKYKTYEKAFEAGLQEAIKLIKK